MGDVTARGLFITGTDTGVGKTVFTSALVRGLCARGMNVAPYKPTCSGAERSADGTLHWGDVDSLARAACERWPCERICPQAFLAPLSPPAAAALEGRIVDESLLREGYRWLAERSQFVLVEGAGGFYSPISMNWLNADLAEQIGLPVVIVAPNRLGIINQSLLTIEAVRRRGLVVAGVVLNRMSAEPDLSAATNADEISRRGGVSVWGEIPFNSARELHSQRLPESMFDQMAPLFR